MLCAYCGRKTAQMFCRSHAAYGEAQQLVMSIIRAAEQQRGFKMSNGNFTVMLERGAISFFRSHHIASGQLDIETTHINWFFDKDRMHYSSVTHSVERAVNHV